MSDSDETMCDPLEENRDIMCGDSQCNSPSILGSGLHNLNRFSAQNANSKSQDSCITTELPDSPEFLPPSSKLKKLEVEVEEKQSSVGNSEWSSSQLTQDTESHMKDEEDIVRVWKQLGEIEAKLKSLAEIKKEGEDVKNSLAFIEVKVTMASIRSSLTELNKEQQHERELLTRASRDSEWQKGSKQKLLTLALKQKKVLKLFQNYKELVGRMRYLKQNPNKSDHYLFPGIQSHLYGVRDRTEANKSDNGREDTRSESPHTEDSNSENSRLGNKAGCFRELIESGSSVKHLGTQKVITNQATSGMENTVQEADKHISVLNHSASSKAILSNPTQNARDCGTGRNTSGSDTDKINNGLVQSQISVGQNKSVNEGQNGVPSSKTFLLHVPTKILSNLGKQVSIQDSSATSVFASQIVSAMQSLANGSVLKKASVQSARQTVFGIPKSRTLNQVWRVESNSSPHIDKSVASATFVQNSTNSNISTTEPLSQSIFSKEYGFSTSVKSSSAVISASSRSASIAKTLEQNNVKRMEADTGAVATPIGKVTTTVIGSTGRQSNKSTETLCQRTMVPMSVTNTGQGTDRQGMTARNISSNASAILDLTREGLSTELSTTPGHSNPNTTINQSGSWKQSRNPTSADSHALLGNVVGAASEPLTSTQSIGCVPATDSPLADVRTLLYYNVIQAGINVLSVQLQMRKFEASLKPNGHIQSAGGEIFHTPMAWLKAVTGSKTAMRQPQAYNKIFYQSRPLSSFSLPVAQRESDSSVKPDSNKTTISTCQWSSKSNCGSVSQTGYCRGENKHSQRTSLLKTTADLSQLLNNCRVRVITDDELVPTASFLPHDFWEKNFDEVNLDSAAFDF